MKKLNKKRGLPAQEPAAQSTKEEGDESASDDGPDMALLPDEPLDESLVMEVLKKEAALEAERGGRSFPSKNRTTRRAKAELVNEGEYLVKTNKSKFRVVDLSANATSSHLRPAVNFKERLLATRNDPRRMSSKELLERQQKLKWICARK